MIGHHFLRTVCFYNFTPFLLCTPPNCSFQIRKVVGAERVHVLRFACFVWGFFGVFCFVCCCFLKKEVWKRTLCEQGMKQCPSSCGFASHLSAVPVLELLPCGACKPRFCARGGPLSFTPSAACPAPPAVLDPASPELLAASQKESSLSHKQELQQCHVRGFYHL